MIKNHRPVLALAVSLALFSGCTSFSAVTSGTDNPCATLQSIVDDYPNGFASYRGAGSSYRLVTLYRAKEQLIKGHCEIWQWGNGDAAYTCTVGAPDTTVAESRFQIAAEQVSSCLGTAWTPEFKARERDGKPAGEAMIMKSDDTSAPAVSLHRVEDGSRQSLYLYVGPASRAPAAD